MSKLNKSVKVLGQVVGLLLGDNCTAAMETAMTNHSRTEFPYYAAAAIGKEQTIW